MKENNQTNGLILPEYGRNIQQMVNHALTIEDKEERTRCAKTIINIMGNLFPYLRDVNDFRHKLWDHLAMMSDFQLDIDYPYEVLKKENLYTKPERIPYKSSRIKYLHYGRVLEQMIEKAIGLPEGEEKESLVMLIANHMKKSFLTWNKEVVDDKKIADDLFQLSDGEIKLDLEKNKLRESRDLLPPNNRRSNRSQYRKR